MTLKKIVNGKLGSNQVVVYLETSLTIVVLLLQLVKNTFLKQRNIKMVTELEIGKKVKLTF